MNKIQSEISTGNVRSIVQAHSWGKDLKQEYFEHKLTLTKLTMKTYVFEKSYYLINHDWSNELSRLINYLQLLHPLLKILLFHNYKVAKYIQR